MHSAATPFSGAPRLTIVVSSPPPRAGSRISLPAVDEVATHSSASPLTRMLDPSPASVFSSSSFMAESSTALARRSSIGTPITPISPLVVFPSPPSSSAHYPRASMQYHPLRSSVAASSSSSSSLSLVTATKGQQARHSSAPGGIYSMSGARRASRHDSSPLSAAPTEPEDVPPVAQPSLVEKLSLIEDLSLLDARPVRPTDLDTQRAHQLMADQRLANEAAAGPPARPSTSNGRKRASSKPLPFAKEDANPVLARISEGVVTPATPGLVQVLLDAGAHVGAPPVAAAAAQSDPKGGAVNATTNLFKKLRVIARDRSRSRDRHKSPADQAAAAAAQTAAAAAAAAEEEASAPKRNHVLVQAVRHCPADVIFLLARHADKEALNEAVPVAVGEIQDPTKASILLARGADMSPHCSAFMAAIESGADELVEAVLVQAELLLASPSEKDRAQARGACQRCRDVGLVCAAALGHSRKVEMLLARGADPTFDGAAALRQAIRGDAAKAGKIALAIASDPRLHQMGEASPDTLNVIMGEAYEKSMYRVVFACLQAGARGSNVDKLLVDAVERQQIDLVEMLMQRGASVNAEGGAAVYSAARSKRPELLQMVLAGAPSQEVMTGAIEAAITSSNLRTAQRMIDALLSAGLQGNSLSPILVQILETSTADLDDITRSNLVRMLLLRGLADVNYDGGRALVLATLGGHVKVASILLNGKPSGESLVAMLEAAMDVEDAKARLKIVQMAMETGTRGPAAGDPTLIARLQHTAMVSAARALHLDVLQYLVGLSPPSADTLAAAFAAAVTQGTYNQWLTPPGLSVVHALLVRGVSGPQVDEAFCQAAKLYERDAVELLATCVGPAALGRALESAIRYSAGWQASDNLWLVHSLLEWGCSGDAVNLALLEAVNNVASTGASATLDALINTLLTVGHRPNVNFEHGEIIDLAVRSGSLALVKKLALNGANSQTMTRAFGSAVSCRQTEDQVIAMIEVLLEVGRTTGDVPNTRALHAGGHSLLAACLAAHPDSLTLVKYLLEMGCDLETRFETQLYPDEDGVGQELATVLTWAMRPLMNNNGIVSSEVIKALIDLGADVNYVAPVSRATPLVLAARYGRADVIAELVGKSASTMARDMHDRSALFYASRLGDAAAVRALVDARSRINDGSLHEAARNLHSEAVALLIAARHDANFPSSKAAHEGRTPLQELAFRSDATRALDVIRLEDTILALEAGHANALARWRGGRNALFLALENPLAPVQVTRALLDHMVWRSINHEHNLFIQADPSTGSRYCYSPSMYLRKRVSTVGLNAACASQLLQLLYDKGCVDRFFIEFQPGEYLSAQAGQPDDAVGLPPRLAEEEERRRSRAHEHRLRMQEQWEEAQQQAEIERLRRSEQLQQQQLEAQPHEMPATHDEQRGFTPADEARYLSELNQTGKPESLSVA